MGSCRLLSLCALLTLGACEKTDTASGSELSRDECVKMVVRVNELENKELGRTNDAERHGSVDSCLQRGTRAQLECVEFAKNAGEVARCSELSR